MPFFSLNRLWTSLENGRLKSVSPREKIDLPRFRITLKAWSQARKWDLLNFWHNDKKQKYKLLLFYEVA